MLETLLHNIAGELVLAEHLEVLADDVQHMAAALTIVALHHMLHDVVAVLVADHVLDAFHQLRHDHGLGRLVAVFEAALDDTAAVRVDAELLHRALERVDDEADRVGRTLLNRLLDDVVAVLVADAL